MSEKLSLMADANVIIDYLKCDRSVIRLINSYVGQLYLATPLLNEIDEMDESNCLELEIKLVEPELHQMILASQNIGALSFQDNLCLLLAQKNGWTLVTNDKALRKRCEKEGIPLIWGIELICILVEAGGLPPDNAKKIISDIQEINPYITNKIVKRRW